MFQVPSSTVVCPSCGKRNSARVNFCTACAGRLGREPSIAPAAHEPPAASRRAGDSRFDQPRTVHSAPMPFAPQTSDSRPLGFWFRFCMTGLVLAIAFATWAVYTMAGSKAVAPSGAAQIGAAPATEPAVSQPQAQAQQVPASSETVVAATPKPAESVASPAPAAPSQTPAPARATPAAPATGASPSAAVAALALDAKRGEAAAASQSPLPAARKPAPRERARPPAQDMDEFIAARGGAWVAPERASMSTSTPGYRDAGPPVVQGPGPLVVPAPAIRDAAATPSGDLGPPIAAGPGPLYDFSTPGASRR